MWLIVSRFNEAAIKKQIDPSKLGFTLDTFNGQRVDLMEDYAKCSRAAREAVAAGNNGKAQTPSSKLVVYCRRSKISIFSPDYVPLHVLAHHMAYTSLMAASNNANLYAATVGAPAQTGDGNAAGDENTHPKKKGNIELNALVYQERSRYPYARIVEAVAREILPTGAHHNEFLPWQVELQLHRMVAMCTSEARAVRRTRDLLDEWKAAPIKSKDNGLLSGRGQNTELEQSEGHREGAQRAFQCPRHRVCPGFPFSTCRWWCSCNMCTPMQVVFRASSKPEFIRALAENTPRSNSNSQLGAQASQAFWETRNARLLAVAVEASKEGAEQRIVLAKAREEAEKNEKKKKEEAAVAAAAAEAEAKAAAQAAEIAGSSAGRAEENADVDMEMSTADELSGRSMFLSRFLSNHAGESSSDLIKACDWHDPIHQLEEVSAISRASVQTTMPYFAETFRAKICQQIEGHTKDLI